MNFLDVFNYVYSREHNYNVSCEILNNKLEYKTYDDFIDDIKKCCSFFERSSLSKGEYVGLKYKDRTTWFIVFWALVLRGNKVVLLDEYFNSKELANINNNIDLSFIVTDTPFENNINNISYIYLNSKAIEKEDFNISFNYESAANELVFCTSGTTGYPKLIGYNAYNILKKIEHMHYLDNKYFLLKKYLNKDKQLFTGNIPFRHCFGFFVSLFLWSNYNSVQFLSNNISPTSIIKLINKFHIDIVYTIPLFWQKLIANQQLTTVNHNVLTMLGGTNVPVNLLQSLDKNNITAVQGYGSTEIGIVCINADNNKSRRNNGAIGSTGDFEHYLSVRNELLIPKENVYDFKYKNRHKIKSKDKYFNTSDFVLEKDNQIFINGRSDNIVVTNQGENVSTEELNIEFREVISILGQINVAIIVTNNKFAFVIKNRDYSEKDFNRIINLVRNKNANLLSYKRISSVFIVKNIPYTSTRKIKIGELINSINNKTNVIFEFKFDQ